MVVKVTDTEYELRLGFGAGRNARASEDKISEAECSDGKNFSLDIDKTTLASRKPYDLVATAPNGEEVRGFGQLQKTDGTLSTLIQAGGTVYEWDGGATFSSVGTVNANARLRGTANYLLDDDVVITDLEKSQPVMTWDGTTFEEMTHNLGADFYAKYAVVEDERVLFGNVTAGSALPHVLVGSKIGDKTDLSTANRPSTALATDDPFYIPIQDLKPINGLVSAFGLIAMSTEKGKVWKMTGASSKDFVIDSLYGGAHAGGDEGFVEIGNDISIAREGKIDTLFGTERFGDVETDDLSRHIQPLIEDETKWRSVFNSRLQRVYYLPENGSKLYVFHKGFYDLVKRDVTLRKKAKDVSPWSVWETDNDFGFGTKAMWVMQRPSDRVLHTYLGGRNGEIYQLEGGGSQDAGATDIAVERLSKVFPSPEFTTFDIEGWVTYKRFAAATLTITIQWSGSGLVDQAITVPLAGATNIPVYGGSLYYNDDNYYTTEFKGRRTRVPITITGQDSDFAIKTEISGATQFDIEEIGVRFTAV